MPSSGVFFILLWLKTFRYGNGFLCLLRWSRSCPMNLCSSGGERVKALSDPHPGNSYTGGLALLLSNTCRLHFTVLYGQRGESLLSLWHSGVGKRGEREQARASGPVGWASMTFTLLYELQLHRLNSSGNSSPVLVPVLSSLQLSPALQSPEPNPQRSLPAGNPGLMIVCQWFTQLSARVGTFFCF